MGGNKVKKFAAAVLALLFLTLSPLSASAEYSIEKAVINKDGQLAEMDISFLTSARMANLFVFDSQGDFIAPSYIKSSDGNYYNLSDFTSARMASAGGTVAGGLELLNTYPSLIKNIQPGIVKYENSEFKIYPTLGYITLQGEEPVITGTDTAPALTFTVTPETIYTTGTAVLSEDVNYTIENKDYYIGTAESPCSATTSDNLVQLALDLLRLVTGNSSLNGVLGSTLIANSPLTITLMGTSGTTVYTVNFVAAAP